MEKKSKYIVTGSGQKFFYEEVLLVHGQKRIDVVKAKENLTLFNAIIEKAPITYGLFFGTLLGAIREGNFILHDEDTDIYILDEHRNHFLNLLVDFQSCGLNLVRAEENLLSLMKDGEYIDVYFFKVKHKLGMNRVRVLNNHFEYSAQSLENPIRYSFLGLSVPVPNHPEALLEKMYGADWRTPIQNHHAPPNTFYNRISSLAKSAKKLPGLSGAVSIGKILLKKLGI